MGIPAVYHARAMADYLNIPPDELRRYKEGAYRTIPDDHYAHPYDALYDWLPIDVPDDGRILVRADDDLDFRGDSSLVKPLLRLTIETEWAGWSPYPGATAVFAFWGGPGGARLALEIMEPRFRDAWRHLLPPEIATADVPIFEPMHQATPGIVY